jgi:hypothetical protein
MRVCILKQPYVTELTWSTQRWSNARELLDNYVLRSQNFGLVCETRADIWVLKDGPYASDIYTRLLITAPEAVEALYRSHAARRWDEVPWTEYDVVISLDPIVPQGLIAEHPEILWCYYEQEHTMGSFARSARSPHGRYDLFLNHALTSSHYRTLRLPASVNFPYVYSRRAFAEVISVAKRECVYLDSHCVRGVSDLEALRSDLEAKFGIEVDHCRPWDFDNSYKCVGDKLTSSTSEYLNQLGSCKYFLLNRGGVGVGQSAPEAAALGVIVLPDRGQIYSRYMCHPETRVEPRNFDSAAAAIRKIQGSRDLQQEIVEYQFERVERFFLEGPLSVLRACLELKRRGNGPPANASAPAPAGALGEPCRRAGRLEPGARCRRDAGRSPGRLVSGAQTQVRRVRSLLAGGPRRTAGRLYRGLVLRPGRTAGRLCRGVLLAATRSAALRLRAIRPGSDRCRKLSVVCGGRNDSYAGNFKERMMAAVERNQREAGQRRMQVEWIFVEWNPTSDDYLSYDLARRAFRCYVVSPEIHKATVGPRVADRMTFMQFFAKNVGIRRATGDWILVTNADCVFDENVWDFVSKRKLCPEVVYRAERCDIDCSYFDKPFEAMRRNISRRHSTAGGRHFTQGSGDFVLFSSRHLVGYDERINFSDAHVDGRFCTNWSALRTGGDPYNWRLFKFIGDVFKADHPLIFAKTQHLSDHPKGFTDWDSGVRICAPPALYRNDESWGLVRYPETQLCDGVWYIG